MGRVIAGALAPRRIGGYPHRMDFIAKGRSVIEAEAAELHRLSARLGDSFAAAVAALREALDNGRKIAIAGVGKSGNIGHKIAATFNSTGATSVVLNAQNALHGDIGIIGAGDVAILMSYSGETQEMLDLLPALRRLGAKVIAMTGRPADSTLAANADIALDVAVEREACPLNLAPTSSSTAMLALGDALAMVLLEARGFREEDFAKFHPGGSLGRALLTKVADIMRTGDHLAQAAADERIAAVLERMTAARAGACVIADPATGRMEGIFTHGDFVRAFQADPAGVAETPASALMTRNPITISADKLAAEALRLLEEFRIDDLVVVGENGVAVGLIDTQDLSRMKIV
ncbi:MAG: KpsF/GutQ family sugar-phosphate isomerase [Verrucomicrobiales bacterium]